MPIGAHLWNQWQAKMSLGTRDQWYGRITSVCIFTAAGTQTDSSWFLFEQETSSESKRSTWHVLKLGGKVCFLFMHPKLKWNSLWVFCKGNLCQHSSSCLLKPADYTVIPSLSVLLSLWNCDYRKMVQKGFLCTAELCDALSVQPGSEEIVLWLFPVFLPHGNEDTW